MRSILEVSSEQLHNTIIYEGDIDMHHIYTGDGKGKTTAAVVWRYGVQEAAEECFLHSFLNRQNPAK